MEIFYVYLVKATASRRTPKIFSAADTAAIQLFKRAYRVLEIFGGFRFSVVDFVRDPVWFLAASKNVSGACFSSAGEDAREPAGRGGFPRSLFFGGICVFLDGDVKCIPHEITL